MTSITPSSGNPSGNTNVTIVGIGFLQSDNLCCRFGNSMPQKAIFINSTTLSCLSPAGWGEVPVQVSLNGQAWTDTSAPFFYQDKPPQPVNFTWFIVATAAVFAVAVLSCISAAIYMSVSSTGAQDSLSEIVVPSIQGLDESAPLLGKSPMKQARDEVAQSDLRIVERIGRGSHGEVFRGYWCGCVSSLPVALFRVLSYAYSTLVAIKKLNAASLTPELENDLKREAAIMEQMRHPNVLQFFSACTVPPNICIVMEYV